MSKEIKNSKIIETKNNNWIKFYICIYIKYTLLRKYKYNMIKKKSKILLIGIILLVLVILVIVLKYKTKLFENFDEITNPSIPPPIYTMPSYLMQMPPQMPSQMPPPMPPPMTPPMTPPMSPPMSPPMPPPMSPPMPTMPPMPPSLPTSKTLDINRLSNNDIQTLYDAKQILSKYNI